MAGHNKWSKVKHKKAVTDAKKSKEFSKLAQEIAMEVKKANGNAESPSVRAVVARAKQANMPTDNIERAIKRGSGKDAAELSEVLYDAYGPAGVAMIVRGLTDNRNRTSAEVKRVLTKHGAQLAEPGAAAWAFEKQDDRWSPLTTLAISEEDFLKLTNLVEELEELEDVQAVYTNAKSD